jgi:DNA-binding NarL/FixJ family response regulator
LAASNDNTAIAEKLCISLNTVSSHLSNIYSKVGLGEKLSRSEKRSLLTKACLMNQSK